jgi:hypothetical protein
MLFLGAGASAPLGKAMMAEFVGKLSTQSVGQEGFELLKLLKRFRGLDLEGILGELDTIISLDYASTVEGSYPVSGGLPADFSINRSRASALRHRIKHEIIREYRALDADKVVELYAPIFDGLFSQLDSSKNVLNVFTTNYDPTIEVFCKRQYREYAFCDGFHYLAAERENVWHRNVFDKYEIIPGKRNIVLFKLHGSVDWIQEKDSGKIRQGQPMFDAMDSDVFSNVLIYPATKKIAVVDPYYTAYEYYQRCCESARACMAIGYSFRDYDALMRLRGARSVNEPFRLVLLAPDAEKILESIPLEESRKTALPFSFGIESHPKYMLAFRDVAGFDEKVLPRIALSGQPLKPSEEPSSVKVRPRPG